MVSRLPLTERSLPIALLRAREEVMQPIREMLSKTDLTEQQWRILRVLSESGPLDSKTLSNRACLLFPSLTRLVTSLRSKNLVTQCQDTTDRRRQIVQITGEGRSLIARHSASALAIADGFRERLGTKDYDLLIELLQRLAPDDDDKAKHSSDRSGTIQTLRTK